MSTTHYVVAGVAVAIVGFMLYKRAKRRRREATLVRQAKFLQQKPIVVKTITPVAVAM